LPPAVSDPHIQGIAGPLVRAQWQDLATNKNRQKGELSMSRAFVKEPEGGEAFEDLPDRPISPHANLVTPEGLAQIEAELAQWHDAHAQAQATQDRAAISHAGRELRYWTARRANAELVPPPEDPDEVHFGAAVTIDRADGRHQTWRIVGEDEADPTQGTLSFVSPLARALMGKRVGDTVMIGTAEVEIVAIG
jgi:transcription elongation GreA/GreB family factor